MIRDGTAGTLGTGIKRGGHTVMVVATGKSILNRIGIGKTYVHVDDDAVKKPNVIWHYY